MIIMRMVRAEEYKYIFNDDLPLWRNVDSMVVGGLGGWPIMIG